MSEYNIKIIKAMNGYVVGNNNGKNIFVVPEGENLGDAIMGMVVGERLTATEDKHSTTLPVDTIANLLKSKEQMEREMQGLAMKQYAYDPKYAAQNATNTAAQRQMNNAMYATLTSGTAGYITRVEPEPTSTSITDRLRGLGSPFKKFL
jgi:hypothetical protein